MSQAQALQEDLRRAKIEPFAWDINKSVLVASTQDPLLAARLAGEKVQCDRVANGLSKQTYMVPWRAKAPIVSPRCQRWLRSLSRPEGLRMLQHKRCYGGHIGQV